MSEETAEAFEPAEQSPVAETPAPETPAPEAVEQPSEDNKGKERLAMRFSELTARIKAAEERAAQAEAALQYNQRQPAPEPEAPAYEYDPQPDITAEVERVLKEREQKAAQEAAQKERLIKAQTLQAKLLESGLEGAVLLATDAKAPVTMEMVEALAVSEQAANIADHLGRNPAEVARIASLPPHLQGYELAKLESRLASQPRTTSALPPPTTVGARALASTDPSGMSMEQYIAAREAGKL